MSTPVEDTSAPAQEPLAQAFRVGARRGNSRRAVAVLFLASIAGWLWTESVVHAQPPEASDEAPAKSVPPSPAPSPSSSATPEPAPSEEREPTMPAPAQANWESRYQELLERQRTLEARVNASAAAIGPRHQAEIEKAAPLAGYSEKNFFLRDPNDWFVLIPKGRLNVDYYGFLSRPSQPPGGIVNGPVDTRPRDTLFLRRARWGIAGTIAKHIDFRIEADFANLPTSGQYASLTDASIVFNYTPFAQVEVGQVYTPFTLENPTSENYADFMEKAAAVRFAVPTSRETGVMLLGESPKKIVRYWVGVFDGEGQNFKNLDYGAAAIGRLIFSPVALIPRHAEWQENIWIGGSAWAEKSDNLGGTSGPSTTGATQGDLSSVTTQAGLSVFNSNYANGVDFAEQRGQGTSGAEWIDQEIRARA